jgi:glutathione S-transferase
MPDLILHHYAMSPFSEKVRRILAYKNMPWRAVEQPLMAPKPDLTPLTGGYRRIPVLQIGADIYCDTTLIVQRIEALYPDPPVIPTPLAGVAALIEDWADHRMFMNVVPPTIVGLMSDLPPGFLDDRQAMTPGFSEGAMVSAAPHALEQTGHALDRIALQLGESAYLLGERFTVADAACFHTVHFLKNNPALVVQIESRPALADWVKRIEAFGDGKREDMTAAEALTIAGAASPADTDGASVTDAGYKVGDKVTVVADDYGQETTVGTVARVTLNEIVVEREDPQVGRVAVHYPRAGYRVSAS